MTTEKRRAQKRADYLKHKEKRLATMRKWREKNKTRKRANDRAWYAKNKEHKKEYDKKYYAQNKEYISERNKKYRKTKLGKAASSRDVQRRLHTIEVKCRRKVNNAIRDGKLTRSPCAVCGEIRTDAHHADYTRPFKIRWLCKKHHLELHNKEKKCMRKLKIEMQKNRRKKWFFRVRSATNGRIICHSESYSTRSSCKRSANALKEGMKAEVPIEEVSDDF